MDIKKLMKQAQTMQKKMQQMQEEIARKEFEGKSGGGMVFAVMSGDGEMKKITIDPSLINLDDKEMLEDLIVAAHNDAKAKADEDSKKSMSGALGGLPPGFNF